MLHAWERAEVLKWAVMRKLEKRNLLGRHWLEDVEIMLKKRFYEMGWERVDWIDQAQDWEKRRAVVNTGVTLWVT
jgi:hypothetical protein